MERKHYYKSTSYHIYHHPFTSFSICILICKTFCYPLKKKIMRKSLQKIPKYFRYQNLRDQLVKKTVMSLLRMPLRKSKLISLQSRVLKKLFLDSLSAKIEKKITTESNSVIIFPPFPKPEGVSIIKFKMEHSYNLSQNIFRKVTKLHEIGQDQKFPVSIFE